MNVSAVNCTPIKPQVSFGYDGSDFNDAQKVLALTKELQDGFDKSDDAQSKSKIGTAVAVAGALGSTFIVGKVAGAKLLTAFPGLAKGISKHAGNAINFVGKKSAEVAGKENANRAVKFLGNHISSLITNASEHAGKILPKAGGADAIFKNALGAASVAAFAPKVLTVDSNNDGMADIAQKNINAYEKAFGVVGELMSVLV